MTSPTTLLPSADSPAVPTAKKPHPVAAATPRRDPPRSPAIPNGNALVHFPTPSGRGPEPFLAEPIPAPRGRPILTPFDPDGASDPAPRRRSPDAPALQSDTNDD